MTKRAPDQAVTPETLAPIVWQRKNVITTELLAELYDTGIKLVQQNFARNVDRFQEGKHYFKLTGEDLQILRTSLRGSQISPKTRGLILWTARGAARHAKMLETDEAWNVFERLEDAYFVPRESATPNDDEQPSTVADRRPALHGVVDMVVTCHMSFPRAYRAVSAAVGAERFAEMTKGQVRVGVDFTRRVVAGTLTTGDLRRMEKHGVTLPYEPQQLRLTLTFGGGE